MFPLRLLPFPRVEIDYHKRPSLAQINTPKPTLPGLPIELPSTSSLTNSTSGHCHENSTCTLATELDLFQAKWKSVAAQYMFLRSQTSPLYNSPRTKQFLCLHIHHKAARNKNPLSESAMTVIHSTMSVVQKLGAVHIPKVTLILLGPAQSPHTMGCFFIRCVASLTDCSTS